MSAAVPTWLIALPRVDSTNTWALAHHAALAHGACVYTTQQQAGRGRGGNVWRSPPGVLTASFVLALPAGRSVSQLALAAGLAIAHAVEDAAPGARLAVKWPNDVLHDGRKLAGVLCERPADSNVTVVGIGMNLDPRWEQTPEALPLAIARTAAVAELAPPPEPLAMLTALRRYLLEAAGLLSAGGWPLLLSELRRRDPLRERTLTVTDGATRVDGIGAGLDDDGRLLVRTDANVRACSAGHVELAD